MNKPTVSIIIPTYNRFYELLDAVTSVLEQTYPQELIEIIIVDDASTQQEYCTLKNRFNENNSVKIIVLSQNSSCIYGKSSTGHVRNMGIQASTGDFIAFLDDDDFWIPRKLEVQLNAMYTHGAHCSSTEAFIFTRNEDGTTYNTFDGNLYNSHLCKNYINAKYAAAFPELGNNITLPTYFTKEFLEVNNCCIASSIVVSRIMLEQCGSNLDTEHRIEDWLLVKKIAEKQPILYISEPLIYYDIRSAILVKNV